MSPRRRTLVIVALVLVAVGELTWMSARVYRPAHRIDRLVNAVHLARGAAPYLTEELGATDFRFSCPDEPTAGLRIEFTRSLTNARVEVYGWSGSSAELIANERVPDRTLEVSTDDRRLRHVEVVVHRHLRERPEVRDWIWLARPRG